MEPEVLVVGQRLQQPLPPVRARARGSTTRSARTVAAVEKKMPIADEINHHPSPGGPGGHPLGDRASTRSAIWKFSKNVTLREGLHQVSLPEGELRRLRSSAGSALQPAALKSFAEHPIWASNPKYAMLPKEAGIRARARLAGQAQARPCSSSASTSSCPTWSPRPMQRHAHQAARMDWGAGSGRARGAGASSRQRAKGIAMAVGPRVPRGDRTAAGPAASRASASGGSRSTSSATA